MDWIKRNLFFVISAVAAAALLGGAGYYLYANWKANNEQLTKLNEAYQVLDRLSKQEPHPGDGKKVDNITRAKQQEQQLRSYMQNAAKHFGRIPEIPETKPVTSEAFAAALRRTVDQLQRDATNASVGLPGKNTSSGLPYGFSFTAQQPLVKFAPGSLDPLSVQLGEVKAICDVLFRAKVNSLDNLRRERVSPDDNQGPQSDYQDQKSVTNELAVLSTYEVSFHCFTPELAAVLTGFGSSPFGFVVRSMNVEPAPATATQPEMAAAPVTPIYIQPQPQAVPQPQTRQSEEQAFRQRYGLGPKGPTPTPTAPTPTPQVYVPPAPAKPTLQTVLNERQLRVTMTIVVIKLLPLKS